MKHIILIFSILLVLVMPSSLHAELASDDFTSVAEAMVPTSSNSVIKSEKTDDALDRKVLLEVKVFQIILSDEHSRGVDWEASISNYQDLTYFPQFDSKSQQRHRRNLSFGNISQEDFDLLVEALDAVGIVNPLSNSQVETRPNGKAKVYVGLTEPYVITMTTNLPVDSYHSDGNLYLSGQGVQFYFTPSIEFDGKIAMNIEPDHHFFQNQSNKDELELRAQDGETIVIGGLIKNEKVERLRKIPLLGDLPILGFAFRNPNQTTQAIEYVIFLTPKIIKKNEK